MINVRKNLFLLSIAFALIFFGYAGVQQFVTIFFAKQGMVNVGFYSLLLVYAFFAVSTGIGAWLVQRLGARRMMLFSSLAYSLFILSLLTSSALLLYASSALLGIAAASLWVGQHSYLVRLSEESRRGERAGFFSSIQPLGAILGILLLGPLIESTTFSAAFLMYALAPIAGFICLFFLQDIRVSIKRDHLFHKVLKNPVAFRLAVLWFSLAIVYGLVITVLPLQIQEKYGLAYVGLLSSVVQMMPIVASSALGKASDRQGRKKMISLVYYGLAGSLVLFTFSASGPWLLLAILVLAFTTALLKPVTTALLGDVSTKENVEQVTALTLSSQQLGVVAGIIMALQVEGSVAYGGALLLLMISYLLVRPLLKMPLEEVRGELARDG